MLKHFGSKFLPPKFARGICGTKILRLRKQTLLNIRKVRRDIFVMGNFWGWKKMLFKFYGLQMAKNWKQ